MPTSSDLLIINETRTGDDLDRCEPAERRGKTLPTPQRRDAEAFAALDSGLEIDTDQPAERYGEAQMAEPYERIEPTRPSAGMRVPLALAAFVVVACASLGAATATLVLHDRVMQITASWTASR